ncbi:MAG: hypothetical protein RL497_1568 [Pseudomonadota bacterium]
MQYLHSKTTFAYATYKRLIKMALPVLIGAALCACNGNDTAQAPKITTPAIVPWAENTPVAYFISATSTESLTYSLLQTADSAQFFINAKTGELTTSKGLDFEVPTDANHDGNYELAVMVVDSSKRSTRHDFMLKIEDAETLKLGVSFPTAGSNVGGYEGNFHIRGRILDENTPVSAPRKGIEVLINGNPAKFPTNANGNWVAEIPLSKGNNTVKIQLLNSGKLKDETQLNFDNSPIVLPSTAVSDGANKIISVDASGRFIVRKSLLNDSIETLASINQNEIKNINCVEFEQVELSSDGTQVVALCRSQKSTHAVLSLNLTTGILRTIVPDVGFLGGYYDYKFDFEWLSNTQLLFKADTQFFVVDLTAGTFKQFSGVAEGGLSDLAVEFFIDGSKVYSTVNRWENGFNLVEFDINDVSALDSEKGTVVARTSELRTDYTQSAKAFAGKVYTASGQFIYETDIVSKQMRSINLQPNKVAQLLTRSGLNQQSNIVRVDGTKLIMRGPENSGLFSVNLSTGEMTPLPSGITEHMLSNSISISPNSDELLHFGVSDNYYLKVSLNDFSIKEERNLSEAIRIKSYYGKMDYDWKNNIIYRYRATSWGGEGPTSDPLIMAFDVNADQDIPLVSTNDLFRLPSPAYGLYRVGNVRVTDDPNVVWFSAVVYDPEGDDLAGVYSLDIKNRKIKLLYQFRGEPLVTDFNEPYLSNYSTTLQGMALTEWNKNYIQLLKKDGSLTTLIPENSPYRFSQAADIDTKGEQMYFVSYLRDPALGIWDWDWRSGALYDHNIASNTQRLVASRTEGRGLPLSSADFKIDRTREVFINVAYGNFMQVDLYSGDRVLKAPK